jgi:hypothetical protein
MTMIIMTMKIKKKTPGIMNPREPAARDPTPANKNRKTSKRMAAAHRPCRLRVLNVEAVSVSVL